MRTRRKKSFKDVKPALLFKPWMETASCTVSIMPASSEVAITSDLKIKDRAEGLPYMGLAKEAGFRL